jgi:hypothetical protein
MTSQVWITVRQEAPSLSSDPVRAILCHAGRGASIDKNEGAVACVAPNFAPSMERGLAVDEFRLDQDLHDSVKAIRESVRQLFEQLRLKTESGDIPGKERLERVPALAKRNFANLAGSNSLLAAKEAWRLVDFLEGSETARLSPRARDGLRLVELDRKMAALRASECWKSVAARLREQLGVDRGDGDPTTDPVGDPAPSEREARAAGFGTRPLTHRHPIWRSRKGATLGLSTLIAVAVAGIAWSLGRTSGNPFACLALEDASKDLLARHWATPPAAPVQRPARTEAGSRIITISDPPNGGPVQSTWTTSQYSYAERMASSKPGGGRSDLRLRVGGWGDTYLALLRVPVPSDRLAHRAVLQLTVLGDVADTRPTAMTLRAIGDDWNVSPGPNNRLWWRDCPTSEAMINHLPPPGPRGSVYEIDITDLYNMWAVGFRPAYGIMLEPEHIGRWGRDRPRYANYSTFYSTRARDAANRPRLVLTY